MPMKADNMNGFIAKLESIATLSDIERCAVASLPVRVQELRSDRDIVCDGDRSSHCCIILKGWAFRYKILIGGRRQIFSFHVAGDIPDLQSLHLPVMDHALATVTQAVVGFIPHQAVRELTAQYPNIAAVLCRDILIDAAIFREWMISMGRRSAYGHLAHLFCELYLKQEAMGLARGHCCSLPINQLELADALGLSNVHVNRLLQQMRREGLINLANGQLEIKAWARLVEAAEFDPTYLHLGQQPPDEAEPKCS